MKVTIAGDPKEITALVLAVQERQRKAEEIILSVSGEGLARSLMNEADHSGKG